MAKHIVRTGWNIPDLPNIINEIGCPLITTDTSTSKLYINIADSMSIYFNDKNSTGWTPWGVTINDVTINWIAFRNNANLSILELVYTDTFVLLKIQASIGDNASGSIFFVNTAEDKTFAGYGNSVGGVNFSVNSLQYIYKVSSSGSLGSPYTLPTLFQYAEESGKIDYYERHPIAQSSIKIKVADFTNILACSTVPLGSSIALPDGRNFLSIGTNAMVELDAEEEEE